MTEEEAEKILGGIERRQEETQKTLDQMTEALHHIVDTLEEFLPAMRAAKVLIEKNPLLRRKK